MAGASARVGPNAVTRMAQALDAIEGVTACDRVFAAAGLSAHRAHPPATMVPEAEVSALQSALVRTVGPRRAARVAREAGLLTGGYLLEHRIPRGAQAVLRGLPRGWSARILSRAIARHAWTFAGSGRFATAWDSGPAFRLEGSPVCRELRTGAPAGYYLAATLERIFCRIVDPACTVSEVACVSAGDEACLFHVHWPGLPGRAARPDVAPQRS